MHEGEAKGDILLFLPGKEEVEMACGMLARFKSSQEAKINDKG